jgi:hypothetical protein
VALRNYWVAGGLSPHGIQLRPLLIAVPAEHGELFTGTLPALVEGEYLRPASGQSLNGLPSEVALTDRARNVLDGWPGAAPEELVENLLAILAEGAHAEPDPARKRRLEKVGETVKDLGVSTASEILSKVVLGM